MNQYLEMLIEKSNDPMILKALIINRFNRTHLRVSDKNQVIKILSNKNLY